jgi:DNA invertase Pin-like site-specific DNA recombinase
LPTPGDEVFHFVSSEDNMKVVIYCRYSCELQNPKSCADQEREVRAGLARLGIDTTEAEVICDAAESGTSTDRVGFDEICRRIQKNEPILLAVDDQSRFTRLGNALALITDLVYAGGRFISVCEQIDTAVHGWKLKVRVMELHHGTCSDEIGNRVRRGQRGRVLEGKSAGDFPFGFESFPIDPEYAKKYVGRGPKPVMGIRIDRRQSKWVIWIFQQFVEGKSINWLARELTRRKVPRNRRAHLTEWFAPTIRAMLSNPKYIGQWTWGQSTTVRNSKGQIKSIPASDDDIVSVERPELRIVPQDLWDQAQQRLVSLRQNSCYKSGEKSRRPIVHYTIAYPTDILMTVLACGYCGAKMHYAGSGKHVYRQCCNSIDGRDTCTGKVRVPAAKARTVLLDFVASLLRSMPDLVARAIEEMRSAVQQIQSLIPAELEQRREELHDAERRRNNLMLIAESGGVDDLEDFKQRLRKADQDVKQLRGEVERLEYLPAAQIATPDDLWIKKRLEVLASTLGSDESATARLLLELIGTVRVFRVVPVGKKFGYQQLRFRISGWKVVYEALRGHLPPEVLEVVSRHQDKNEYQSPEFCLDVGGPHKLDLAAPRIAELRANGMKWKDIAKETGLSMDLAFHCWRRYTAAQVDPSELAPEDYQHEQDQDKEEDPNKEHGAA